MIVHCIGLLRSGSTLQYNLVVSLVEKLGIGRGEGSFVAEQFFDPRKHAEWENDNQYHIIKMHNLHPRDQALIASGKMKTCSIIRDIRDVAVSIKLKQGLEGENLCTLVDEAIAGYYRIKSIPGVFIQVYEQVVPDLHTAIAELANFLNIPVDRKTIESIARECSLDSARKVTEKLQSSITVDLKGKPLPQVDAIMTKYEDKKTLLHPNHISKNSGASGVWRYELTQEEIDTITRRQKEWLYEIGYLSVSGIPLANSGSLFDFFTKKDGFFVEVGSGEGIKLSQTLCLENCGWQGFLIESEIEPCAHSMSSRPKSVTLNYECVSTDYYNAWSHRENGAKKACQTRRTGNPRPLSGIFDEFQVESVDLLVINSMKNCMNILKGVDLFRHRPRYIITQETGNGEVFHHLHGFHYMPVEQVSKGAYARTVMYESTARQ